MERGGVALGHRIVRRVGRGRLIGRQRRRGRLQLCERQALQLQQQPSRLQAQLLIRRLEPIEHGVRLSEEELRAIDALSSSAAARSYGAASSMAQRWGV